MLYDMYAMHVVNGVWCVLCIQHHVRDSSIYIDNDVNVSCRTVREMVYDVFRYVRIPRYVVSWLVIVQGKLDR